MPDNMNPYMDSGMNPNGYVPGYGQPGYVDETNPYAAGWDQGPVRHAAGLSGHAPAGHDAGRIPQSWQHGLASGHLRQPGGPNGRHARPSTACPTVTPTCPTPTRGTEWASPMPTLTPSRRIPWAQPQYDPMQQVPMPGQTGQQAPVSPGQTGGFENPMQAAQQAVAEPQVPAAMPQPDPAAQAAAAAAEAQAKQPGGPAPPAGAGGAAADQAAGRPATSGPAG